MSHSIDPGEGWRILEKDELVKDGDECRHCDCARWVPTCFSAGSPQAPNHTYRRRVEQKQTTSEAPDLAEALETFFDLIGYKKWSKKVDSVDAIRLADTPYSLGTVNFERLYEALLKHRPPKEKVIPTQASLSDGPVVAEFRDSEIEPWNPGKLIAIAVSGDCRFFDDDSDEWYALCRIDK